MPRRIRLRRSCFPVDGPLSGNRRAAFNCPPQEGAAGSCSALFSFKGESLRFEGALFYSSLLQGVYGANATASAPRFKYAVNQGSM